MHPFTHTIHPHINPTSIPTYQPPSSSQTTDCNINSNYNSGCQTYWSPNTFGQSFNSHKGGYIAITRSASKGISMYFWSRTDRSIPPEITSTKYQTINVNAIGVGNGNGKWGTPQAYFPASSTCDFNAHFVPHNLVFDLTFCVRNGVLSGSLVLILIV